jgi:hypothetical protein
MQKPTASKSRSRMCVKATGLQSEMIFRCAPPKVSVAGSYQDKVPLHMP